MNNLYTQFSYQNNSYGNTDFARSAIVCDLKIDQKFVAFIFFIHSTPGIQTGQRPINSILKTHLEKKTVRTKLNLKREKIRLKD